MKVLMISSAAATENILMSNRHADAHSILLNLQHTGRNGMLLQLLRRPSGRHSPLLNATTSYSARHGATTVTSVMPINTMIPERPGHPARVSCPRDPR